MGWVSLSEDISDRVYEGLSEFVRRQPDEIQAQFGISQEAIEAQLRKLADSIIAKLERYDPSNLKVVKEFSDLHDHIADLNRLLNTSNAELEKSRKEALSFREQLDECKKQAHIHRDLNIGLRNKIDAIHDVQQEALKLATSSNDKPMQALRKIKTLLSKQH